MILRYCIYDLLTANVIVPQFSRMRALICCSTPDSRSSMPPARTPRAGGAPATGGTPPPGGSPPLRMGARSPRDSGSPSSRPAIASSSPTGPATASRSSPDVSTSCRPGTRPPGPPRSWCTRRTRRGSGPTGPVVRRCGRRRPGPSRVSPHRLFPPTPWGSASGSRSAPPAR